MDIFAAGCMFAEILNGQPLFAGESDIDQLYQIMRCLGSLPQKQADIFARNPIYVGVKLPTVKATEPLSKKFPGLDKPALSLLKACLRYDPEERDSCSKLLAHPYFAGFEEWFKQENKAALARDKEEREAQFREHQKRTGGGGAAGAATTGKTPAIGTAKKGGSKSNEEGAPSGSPRGFEHAMAAASSSSSLPDARSRGGSANNELLLGSTGAGAGAGAGGAASGDDDGGLALPSLHPKKPSGGGDGSSGSNGSSDASSEGGSGAGGAAPLVLDRLGSGHSARGSKDRCCRTDTSRSAGGREQQQRQQRQQHQSSQTTHLLALTVRPAFLQRCAASSEVPADVPDARRYGCGRGLRVPSPAGGGRTRVRLRPQPAARRGRRRLRRGHVRRRRRLRIVLVRGTHCSRSSRSSRSRRRCRTRQQQCALHNDDHIVEEQGRQGAQERSGPRARP